MSNLVSQLFERLGDIVPEVGAEISRLGTQGAMETASALFNGNAFVPYGPGQYTPSPTGPDHPPEVDKQQEVCMER